MKLRLICATIALAVMGGVSHAQDYPSRNIQIIVPFPPGGIVDAAARLIQPELEKRLGRSVLIDNRSGAGGAVGTQAVVRAEPDGSYAACCRLLTCGCTSGQSEPFLRHGERSRAHYDDRARSDALCRQ